MYHLFHLMMSVSVLSEVAFTLLPLNLIPLLSYFLSLYSASFYPPSYQILRSDQQTAVLIVDICLKS